eukprot:515527-Rhodomonas_salina.1
MQQVPVARGARGGGRGRGGPMRGRGGGGFAGGYAGGGGFAGVPAGRTCCDNCGYLPASLDSEPVAWFALT